MTKHEEQAAAPRWMKLAAALRAEPAPGTLARVRARLASRADEPSWILWLAQPVAVAASAALLIVSAIAANALLAGSNAETADAGTLTAALLDDDGSFGLGVEHTTTGTGAASGDSGEVAR
jgi:hypothetical protein